MSARQREERLRSPRLVIPDWSGTLNCTVTITGHLICSMTGWRMALSGTPDGRGVLQITARFDSPTFADDAAPWTDEHELAKPHEAQVGGYDFMWRGSIRSADRKAWAGEMGDRYGGRLELTGTAQGGGVMSLRAVAWIKGQRP